MQKIAQCANCPFKKCPVRNSTPQVKASMCQDLYAIFERFDRSSAVEASEKRENEMREIWRTNPKRCSLLWMQEISELSKLHNIPKRQVIKASPDMYSRFFTLFEN